MNWIGWGLVGLNLLVGNYVIGAGLAVLVLYCQLNE